MIRWLKKVFFEILSECPFIYHYDWTSSNGSYRMFHFNWHLCVRINSHAR